MQADRVGRPSDPSAALCIEVYAAFKVQPALGAGEQLRNLMLTVEQLLDRSEKGIHEWDRICTRAWVLTARQPLASSQRMGTLNPRVRPFWLLSNGGSVKAVIHQHRGLLVLVG